MTRAIAGALLLIAASCDRTTSEGAPSRATRNAAPASPDASADLDTPSADAVRSPDAVPPPDAAQARPVPDAKAVRLAAACSAALRPYKIGECHTDEDCVRRLHRNPQWKKACTGTKVWSSCVLLGISAPAPGGERRHDPMVCLFSVGDDPWGLGY